MVVGSNSMSEHQLTDRSNRHHHSSSRYMGMKGNEMMQHHKAAMESDESEDDELPILPRQPIPVLPLLKLFSSHYLTLIIAPFLFRIAN